MEAPALVLSPPRTKMLRNGAFDVLHHASSCNCHHATWLHEPREVIEIQIVRSAAVGERIDTDDGVEEFRREGQRPSVRVNRKDAVLDAGVSDALESFRDAAPQVG